MKRVRASIPGLLCGLSLLAGSLAAQVSSYEMKLEKKPGLVVVTFRTPTGDARAFFADDIAPGEVFSGAMEATRTYVFEFGGQSTRTDSDYFRWKVPQVRPGEFVPLVLKDIRGKELARTSIPISAPAAAANSFRFPKFIQAGGVAPIAGPFDGDASTSIATAGNQRLSVLAESHHRLVVRVPEAAKGALTFSVRKGSTEKSAVVHSLMVNVRAAKSSLRLGETSSLDFSIAGLGGIPSMVPLKLVNKSPGLVSVYNGTTFFSQDEDFIFIRPSDIPEDGTIRIHRDLEGIQPGDFDVELSVLIPQTPREEVEMILRTPAPRTEAPRLRAAALRTLDFDAIPVVEEYLTDFELGSDAAYAALEADEGRVLPRLFASMSLTGANIQRIGLSWFLSHYHPAYPPASLQSARDAAIGLLNKPQGVGTDIIEMALFAVGLAGDASDRVLVGRFYSSSNRMPGAKRLADASEAAAARLDDATHLENIRKELETPVPSNPGPEVATRLLQILQKAGFSGRRELIPGVCSHLADGVIVDIDVNYDVALAATQALGAISENRTPIGALPRRGPEEWKAYCANPAQR